MALRKILTDGDPALHKMCRPVTSFDARLHTLLDDLKETLADANGAGLAAPQVGILRRVVIVVDAEDNMLELVNPEILTQEGEQEGFEGCLSVPGRWAWSSAPTRYGCAPRTATAISLRPRGRRSWPDASATRLSIWTATCSPSMPTGSTPLRSWTA